MVKASKPVQSWPADKIERRAVDALKPYKNNARTHSPGQVEQIARSIQEWGWTQPALIDERDGIIAGHGRVEAAKLLGVTEVPVIVARGWSKAQKRAYVLADNQLALNAGWDMALLKVEVGALGNVFDMSLVGFGDDFMAEIMATKVGEVDPDEAPAAPSVPVSRLGDLWNVGNHRVLCGDSCSREAVFRLLDGTKPNLMVTDPPYGVEYDAAWRKTVGLASGAATGKVENDDRADWREAWELFPGNVCYVWHGALHNVTVSESLIAAGFNPRAQIVWVKTRPVISRGNYHWQHEPAFYAERAGGDDDVGFVVDQGELAYFVKAGKTANWHGDRKQSSVWMIEHIKSDTGHSTQKPVECMRRPLLNNSRPGDAVYEPFCGSGTTLIACEMEGRRAYCMELSPSYVDVIVKRWQLFTGKKARLDGDGRTFDEISEEREGKTQAETEGEAKAETARQTKARKGAGKAERREAAE